MIRNGIISAAGAVTILLSCPTVSIAQNIERAADGTVSVHASNVPLKLVLESMSSFERLTIDPEIQNVPVTVAVDSVTIRQALIAILKASQVNYAMSADEEGRSIRLAAGNRAVMDEARAHRASLTPTGQAPDPPADSSPGLGLAAAAPEPPTSGDRTEAERFLLLQQALSAPPVKAQTGTLITLPFPGPEGQPITVVVPPKGTPVALPFPPTAASGMPGRVPAAAQPSAAVPRNVPVQLTVDPVTAPPDK